MATDEELKDFVPPLARAQLIFELFAFIACFLVTAGQLGLLDFYFVHYDNYNKLWLIWIVADCIVLGIMCWLFHFAITYSRRCLKKPCKDEANLKYAFVAWLVYSVILSAKIATFFPMFAHELLPSDKTPGDEQKRQIWGPVALKFILAMSAVIFLLLVLSHHYNRMNNPRAQYLSYMSSVITIDLLDSVLFLELLVEDTVAPKLANEGALRIVIIVFACINFMLPTLSLFKLRYKKGLPSWLPFPYEKLYALFYFLFVNVPYLIIRSYLWRSREHDVSIFLVKNVIMVALGIRDVWVGFLIWREKRALKALRQQSEGQRSQGGHLTEQHHHDTASQGSGDRLQQA